MTAFYPCAPDLTLPSSTHPSDMGGFPAVLSRGRDSQKRKRCPEERTVLALDWADAKMASSKCRKNGETAGVSATAT